MGRNAPQANLRGRRLSARTLLIHPADGGFIAVEETLKRVGANRFHRRHLTHGAGLKQHGADAAAELGGDDESAIGIAVDTEALLQAVERGAMLATEAVFAFAECSVERGLLKALLRVAVGVSTKLRAATRGLLHGDQFVLELIDAVIHPLVHLNGDAGRGTLSAFVGDACAHLLHEVLQFALQALFGFGHYWCPFDWARSWRASDRTAVRALSSLRTLRAERVFASISVRISRRSLMVSL